MHFALGTKLAAAIAGLMASTAFSFAMLQSGGPGVGPLAFAPLEKGEHARVQLTAGEAYVDRVHVSDTGEPVAYTLRVGAGSALEGRFTATFPVMVDAASVIHDSRNGTLLVPFGERELLALQADMGEPLDARQAGALRGSMAVTDGGHRFGQVEDVRNDPHRGTVLNIRIAGAGGELQTVPETCVSQVPQTGLLVVRTCNLSTV